MQRIIANLLDNAVKFSPKASIIQIEAKMIANQIVIKVIDQGQGIPKIEQTRIFERFYRGDDSRSTPGTGLGLSFCKVSIEAMRGKIECFSQEKQGTAFIVTLPKDSNWWSLAHASVSMRRKQAI